MKEPKPRGGQFEVYYRDLSPQRDWDAEALDGAIGDSRIALFRDLWLNCHGDRMTEMQLRVERGEIALKRARRRAETQTHRIKDLERQIARLRLKLEGSDE